eukprot:CAMPEP_0172684040 /NCGR_PEP_ID=MMETSP1074-20121228/19273_1 /TAXON_ID=2916 /ORGANISM="Ceratium fusus, Strain PA161109" /LENGTH=102 /DNA_ID=CAMNT_0013502975 /DNA_START=527 /DNA_END=836 /DNA_ORIENTATION=+
MISSCSERELASSSLFLTAPGHGGPHHHLAQMGWKSPCVVEQPVEGEAASPHLVDDPAEIEGTQPCVVEQPVEGKAASPHSVDKPAEIEGTQPVEEPRLGPH